jgi:uncharacterized protein
MMPKSSFLTLCGDASVRAVPTQAKTRAGQRRWRAARYIATLFCLFSLVGCSLLNPYIFIAKKGLPATPDKFGIPYDDVWFTAGDGEQLNGWFLPAEPGKPLVLFFHGNAGNLSDNLEYLNLLHGSGFPVFIFDYRGYGNSYGWPFRENDLYQDARGALAYLEGQGWSHAGMIYFGQSLGSAVALQMALETPPAGLVMESSFTSMREIVKHVSPLAYYTVGWWGIHLPFDNFAKIGSSGVPLLLIHGDRDPVVPVQMTMRLFARAGTPKMLHIIKGGGHCNVFQCDSLAYLGAWGSLLQKVSVRTAAEKVITP